MQCGIQIHQFKAKPDVSKAHLAGVFLKMMMKSLSNELPVLFCAVFLFSMAGASLMQFIWGGERIRRTVNVNKQWHFREETMCQLVNM